jgi:hypothetical protein
MTNQLRGLITPEEFVRDVVPELQRRWAERCYCANPAFVKLVSFDFRDYGVAPMQMADAEAVIRYVIFERFIPVRAWVDSDGGSDRLDRCPQCASVFQSRFDQYSISMERTTSHPIEPRPKAAVGYFVVGFRYFAHSQDALARVTDFERASSVADFIERLSGGTAKT